MALRQRFTYSSKPFIGSPFDDAKLKEIIESSNLGSAKREQERLEKERQAKEKERKEREEREERKEREEREARMKQETERKGEKVQIEKNKHEQLISQQGQDVKETGQVQVKKEPLDKEPSNPTNSNSSDTRHEINMINEEILEENKGLPSVVEKHRSELAKRLEAYLESLQETIFTATRVLNDATGYSAIEKLKFSIDKLEEELSTSKDEVKAFKNKYSEVIQIRSKLQREVNDLLTRKHNWTPDDLERFTELYRNDHANEQRVLETEKQLSQAELKVDAVQLRLTQLILTRYHEEQIWSDKIRRASTWGTWILMGINIGVFVVATLIVEPWKRRRLVASFEEKVKQMIGEEGKYLNTEVIPQNTMEEGTNETAIPVTSESSHAYHLSFNIFRKLWEDVKSLIYRNYTNLLSSGITNVELEKNELGILATVLSAASCGLGFALAMYFR